MQSQHTEASLLRDASVVHGQDLNVPDTLECSASPDACAAAEPLIESTVREQASKLVQRVAALTPLMLAACGGGQGETAVDPDSGLTVIYKLPGYDERPLADKGAALSDRDAARFLTQTTFGMRSAQDVTDLQTAGVEQWLWKQFNAPCVVHTSYLDLQSTGQEDGRATEEMSYEVVWRQWLFEEGQLRARVAFALSEIFVISNIAPDIKPYAMSSYWDLLNRHAFGNFRFLLKDVTLHPAMGYYLNMLQSEKENAEEGVRPNENYAREVLQLFSIGLVKLNIHGEPQSDANGPIPTYDESVVKGFARAFSGWSFGGQGRTSPDLFYEADYGADINWVTPMAAFADWHEPGTKKLLNGKVLPAGQTPEKDMEDAIDNIFNHPNVGPFIARQLIQRLVTSNPDREYVKAVASVFNNDGNGLRGNLKAVIRAILLYKDARGDNPAATQSFYGKQREPVIRLANVFRAFNATTPSKQGRTELHYLDSAEDGLGQSPLLAPSVFNFFSPAYRPAGPLAQAGKVAPEFQITTETTMVSCFNTFASVFNDEGYGWGDDSRLSLNFKPWRDLALQPDKLVARMDQLLCNGLMGAVTRNRLLTLIKSLPSEDWQLNDRIKQAFILLCVSPDFVIQK